MNDCPHCRNIDNPLGSRGFGYFFRLHFVANQPLQNCRPPKIRDRVFLIDRRLPGARGEWLLLSFTNDKNGHDGEVHERRLMGCELDYLKPDIGNINIFETGPVQKHLLAQVSQVLLKK